MKTHTRTLLFTLLVPTLLISGGIPRWTSGAEDVPSPKRISFQVVTVEERAGVRKVISNATIEGPPGTDFVLELQSRRFKMNARFLTDLILPGELKVRAKLNTRRLYGYSQNNLPLYEEDNQSEALRLGFDEQMVLLPFGKGSGELLKVEVTPSISEQPVNPAPGEMQPPTINISEPGPGVITIHALKIPHHFDVEAVLLEDGREVARGESPCSIEEAQEILLQPNDRSSLDIVNNPLAVNLTITSYERNPPLDQAAINFDVNRINKPENAAPQPVARNWAGIAAPGSSIDYDLDDHYLRSGRKYELRFRVKLAKPGSTN